MDEQDDGDPAAEAFEEIRGEVALLRRAVERLAAERQELPEPIDYSETLGHLQQGVTAATNRIDLVAQAVGKMPTLKMTPEEMAQRISAASSTARREDQAAIVTVRQSYEDRTRQLERHIRSARTGERQNLWLIYTGGAGAVAGMLLWVMLAGPIARSLPESWHMPEGMAAGVLDKSMWQAGLRMMQVASPDGFASIAAGDRIVAANRETLEACRKRANKAREAVRCTIDVEADATD